MEGDTESLRKAAPQWSLDGDKQLLGMLQKIHQKIMTKCEEANMKLGAMVDALDNASIDLQNVNNKFMALSNNQFVESRVYDDDVDVSTEANISKAEPPVMEVESEITKLKRSLQRLEEMHEPVHILDSDSSDDEDEGRIIMKPKQMYSRRPLPYIIGTQEWKNIWHAGLLEEESDSDSSVSKQDNIPAEEYSESEPETVPTEKLELANRTISSSSMESEVTSQPQASSQIVRQPAKPADIAAELARRLGGPLQLPASEPVQIQTPPEQTSKKVYRVEKPAPTTIFTDEPPPSDDYQSYKSDYTDDDDIFAELHRKPDPSINKDQNRVSKDLFGGISDDIVEDLFGEVDTRDNDIGNVLDYQDVKVSASASQKTPVFDDRQQPKIVTENPGPKPRPIETKAEIEGVIRKPIGGISLFGTNKGTESIGAAILKRSQRKSSNSDEDTNNAKSNELKVEKEKIKEEPVNKIIEDLFSKPAKKKTNNEETIRREKPEKVETSEKIDLFSDNLFDDIDDIFINNIVTQPKASKTQKSIFDDDDLFSDITLKIPEKHNDKSDTKDNFDKSDSLFGEKVITLKAEANSSLNIKKRNVIDEGNANGNIESNKKAIGTISKGLFDDDSDDELFSDVRAGDKSYNPRKSATENVQETKLATTNNDNKFLSTGTAISEVKESVSSNSQVERSSLFGNDEFDDLLTAQTKPSSEQTNLNEATLAKNNYGVENNQISESSKSSKTDNEVIIRKNNLENEIEKSCNTIEENKEAAAKANNSYISDVIKKSKLEESPSSSDKYIINANKQFPKTSYLTGEANISMKPAHLQHSETVLTDDKSIPSPDILPESLTSESMEPGTFSDIFTDLPPAFEKPLEPKKSKNVNALFDDDSDDEALFFKKNEAISDEKPDLSFSSDRFRIFHDEPPEIDVNFSQKVLKNTSNLVSGESDDELFESSHKLLEPEQTDVSNSVTDVNETIYKISLSEENKEMNVVNITKLIEDSVDSEKSQETNDINLQKGLEQNAKTGLSKVLSDNTGETLVKKDLIEESEPKKPIGKLKNMNFNINVNTLLPGASLRKSKTNEETDGRPISTKSNEELHIHSPEKTETKMVKSASFDGDPESEVLDNKYSKQRAKIQVKRRPSSRRARLEAVRKSRIVLASDSTDNSSSFDEPPYKEKVKRDEVVDNVNSTSTPGEFTNIDILKKNTIAVDITNPTKSPSLPEKTQKDTAIFTDTNSTQGDVKSKIVYILNDEDIFSDINLGTSNNTESNKVDTKNVLDIGDDDDDEFLFKSPNVSTLGKTYENKTVSSSGIMKPEPKTSSTIENDQNHSKIAKDKLYTTKKSFFDDLSDDENELFGSKNPTVHKTNTFDFDSDGELLFVNSKRDSKSNVELKKEIIKGSLFGEESDDDNDLFGVKIGKSSGNFRQNTTKTKDETPRISRSQEPVFEDPLSMFGDES